MSNNHQERPHQELLKEQTMGEENQTNTHYSETFNTELVHREPIPKTPFHYICVENKRHFITIGKYRISKECESKEEAFSILEDEPYEIIFNLIITLQAVDKQQ